MISSDIVWFDVLLARPRKKQYESLTGLVIRLCDENAITSVDEASLLFFPLQSRRIIRFMQDYPPLNLGQLARISQTSEKDLRQGTFESIGRKFGRSIHPQALSRFLADTISPYLRLCPPCMAINPYHRLTWRFLDVRGCLEHNCCLVDTCTNCNRKVPLFKAPFKLGRCAYCDADLSYINSLSMTTDERDQTEKALEDIKFLLEPCDWEDNTNQIIKSVGEFLAKQRNGLKKSREEFACQIGISESMLSGIELARFSLYGATFQAYKAYGRLVGLNLKQVFQGGLALGNPAPKQLKMSKEALVQKSQEAIDNLLYKNNRITGRAVAEIIGIQRRTLIMNEQIAKMIAEGEAKRRQQVIENDVTRAENFLRDLYLQGESCSQDTLAKYLGMSPSALRSTHQLVSLLRNRQYN